LQNPIYLEICRTDQRYAYEVYVFVEDAMRWTQGRLGRNPQEGDEPDADHHVSARELVEGICELASLQFGLLAICVFRAWGIHKTSDLGQLVFNLVKAEKIAPSEHDSLEDFEDLFELEQVLVHPFEIVLAEPKKGYR